MCIRDRYYTSTPLASLNEQTPIALKKIETKQPKPIKLTKKIAVPQLSESLVESVPAPSTREPKEPLNDIFSKCDIAILNAITEDNITAQLSNADKMLYKEYSKSYKYSPRMNTEGHQYSETEYAMKCLKTYLKTAKGDIGLTIKLKKKPIILK